MPFVPYPHLGPNRRRNAIIQIRGPKDKKQIKRLNEELKKVLRKHGATYKKKTNKRG